MITKIKKILPKDPTDWFVSVGLIIFLTSYIVRRILIFYDPTYDTISLWMRLFIIGNLEMLGLGVGMCAMIILGIQRLRMSGLKRKPLFQLILGILTGATFVVLNLLLAHFLTKTTQITLLSDETLTRLELRLDKETVQPSTRKRLEELIASEKYQKTGAISSYLNDEGTRVRYEPTEKDMEMRASLERIKSSIPHFRKWSYIWIGVIITSLIIGLTTKVKKVPKNSCTNQI